MQQSDDDELLEDTDEGLPIEADAGDQRLPEHWMEDEEVEALDVPYSDRAPTDWVISGPLGTANMKDDRGGRRFMSWTEAERWARGKYGDKFKGRLTAAANSGCNRWAFLIKKLDVMVN